MSNRTSPAGILADPILAFQLKTSCCKNSTSWPTLPISTGQAGPPCPSQQEGVECALCQHLDLASVGLQQAMLHVLRNVSMMQAPVAWPESLACHAVQTQVEFKRSQLWANGIQAISVVGKWHSHVQTCDSVPGNQLGTGFGLKGTELGLKGRRKSLQSHDGDKTC